LYSDFVNSSLFEPVLRCFSRVANLSSSLLFDVDNNTSKCYNAIVNQFVGGKRIIFSLKGSYEGRCYSAIVDYNTKGLIILKTTEKLNDNVVEIHTQKF
jgi:hypothetical protein